MDQGIDGISLFYPGEQNQKNPAGRAHSHTHTAATMGGIDGDEYRVSEAMIEAFERDGYVHIPGS